MQALDQKQAVEELKTEWKKLWMERIDDRYRAEGIAKNDYFGVFVERGTVILATRNFRLLNFRDVLERHGIIDVHKFVSPDARVGGWGKYIRSTFAKQRLNSRMKRAVSYIADKKEKQHLKKGGRGWVHL